MSFFYIALSGSDEVIGVSGNSNGSKLRVSEISDSDSDKQLWRWMSDGSLLNKSAGLVIDVKGEKTEEGTVVHAWKMHGAKNQRWHIEDSKIKSQSGDDLNITKMVDHSLGVMHTGHYAQKWTIVPEKKWEGYEFYVLNPNALLKSMFLKTILSEHMDVILGCTFEEYEEYLKQAVVIGNGCSDTLDGVAKDVGIAKVTGGGVAIAGGVAAILGVVFAPFTAGASLVMTVGGAIASGAGGLANLGAAITDHCYNKDEMAKVKPVVDKTVRVTFGLRSILLEICMELEKAQNYLKTPEGKSFFEEIRFWNKTRKKLGKTVVKVGTAGKKGVDAFRAIKDMKALAAFIQADVYAVRAAATGTAEFAAAGGLKVPYLGKTLLAAGGVGAKVFSSALAVVGIAFGIADVVSGAKQIQEGSPIATELRKSVKEIEKQGNDLIKMHKELFNNH